MITTAHATKTRLGYLAMPISRCAQVAWTRALPELKGDVSVQGTGIRVDVRTAAADLTFPGTHAWSPPI